MTLLLLFNQPSGAPPPPSPTWDVNVELEGRAGRGTPHEVADFVQGDTWQIAGRLLDVDGEPVNLTIVSDIIWRLDDARGRKNFLTKSLGDGITITGTITGECLIEISADETIFVPPNSYRDQMVIENAGGLVSTLWIGPIRVLKANV